jgi:LCP family protein required for cell wall assembly
MFEKKKIKFSLENKKDKLIKISDNITVNYISYIGVIIIFLLSIFILNKINVENFKIYEVIKNTSYANLSEEEKNKIQLIQKNREKLKIEKLELELKKKTDSDKKNILIIWRGGDRNDAPELTDSIILLSYYKKKNHISLLSIPRDLYIDYDMVDNQWKKIKWKINALYVTDLEKTQNREKSIKKLGNKIEEITNEEIDFYINIDFRGFIKLIDLIWWVKIDVQKTLVDEEYPDKNHWFQTFILRKWKWLLDWKIALKYVRSRKNTGWDFWRSNRQQQVIKSLKEKLLSSQYLASPSKIEELYNIFDKYIVTDIWIVDFVKLATSIKLQNHLNFYSSTLNTSCILIDECEKGWFLFYPQRTYFWGQSVLLSWKSTYLNLW